jgi:hypothetical protein
MVLLEIEGSYGLFAFTPLGLEQVYLAVLLGTFDAAIACIVSALAAAG